MKTVRYPSYFLLLLTLGLGLGATLRAEDKTSAAPAPEAAPVAPAPAAVEPAKDETAAEAPAKKEDDLRELGATEDEQSKSDSSTEEKTEEKPSKGKKRSHPTVIHSSDRERVNVGGDTTLKEGERAEVVVSVLGSSTSAGEVNDAVVSVLGSSRVTGGTVGNAVVSVLGDTYVNGHVRGEVVTVLGDVEFGPNAVVDGEVVCVGGELKRDPGAILHGNVQNVGIRGVTTWFRECALKLRLLAFDFRVWWAWGIALAFLTFYFVLAVIVPSAVTKCAETLEQRAGSSLITAILVLILTPIAYLLMAFTIFLGGLGFVLMPLFSVGLFMAALFGKVTMLVWIGRRFAKLLGDSPLTHPAVSVLIGGTVMLGLYTIPIVGLISYKLLGILGLGVVIYTLILQFQAAKAARPAPAPKAAPAAATMGAPPVSGGEGMPPLVAPVPAIASAAPPVISAATLPRVGFWLRLGASFLDFILVAMVIGMLSSLFHGWFSPGGSVPLWFAIYCVIMWATKGTTIGGIICGLKVVRLDDRPIDWGVAVVRALGAFLSLAVAGLGFIWVSFDDDRQSWHDKIAGTTIVKVPKGTPLM